MDMSKPDTQTANIIEALNLAELPEAEQEEMLLDLQDLVFKGTMVRLIEMMDEKTREEFSALLDKDAAEEEIEAFIEKHVPNADAVAQDTMDELTDDILAVTK